MRVGFGGGNWGQGNCGGGDGPPPGPPPGEHIPGWQVPEGWGKPGGDSFNRR